MSNGYGRKEKRNITIQRRSDGRFTILDEAPEKIFCGKSRVRTSLRIRYLPSFIWSKNRRKFKGYFVLIPCVLSLHNHPSFKKDQKWPSNQCELTNFYISSSYPPPSSSYTPSSRRSTEELRGSAGGSGGYRGSGGSGGYRTQGAGSGGLEREEGGFGGGRGMSGGYSTPPFHRSSASSR